MMTSANKNPFGAAATLDTSGGTIDFFSLQALGNVDRLPFSLRVLLESALRNVDGVAVTEQDVRTIADWTPTRSAAKEIPFIPARVLLQDFTGVPAVVDLAAMRDAMTKLGGDPQKINPLIPADLVIDHSVQVDAFGSADALGINADREFTRNLERYQFLRWGQQAFDDFRVVPPATGIVHQVNLEYLASVVGTKTSGGVTVAFPDSLVGTDSHTTMINGLGVVGWGVGGIEAEATMLGQPYYMLLPDVVGFRLSGALSEGTTATDLVLTVVEMLRRKGVVGKFVEFFGPGLSSMTLPDRATVANMAPEYGATMGFFPVDEETLRYLKLTARPAHLIDLVERYTKEQGLFRTDETSDPTYTDKLELDLSTVEPSMAGPKRPQDRVPLSGMKSKWRRDLGAVFGRSASTATSDGGVQRDGGTSAGSASTAVLEAQPATGDATVELAGERCVLKDGLIVIAAITSCTNTSNPSVMVAAGLVAKKAHALGLRTKPWVKTSLAPGSRVVTEYLAKAELTPHLDALGFNLVGYGCTTCIGNSGPLPEPVAGAVSKHDLIAAAVLSGNRNFEGRIHPLVKANYLASPPLVVAYALAGTVDIDLSSEPLGSNTHGDPVFLKDIWPSQREVAEAVRRSVTPEQFAEQYGHVFDGNESWNRIKGSTGATYAWDDKSTYVQNPPFFDGLTPEVSAIAPIVGARVLVMVGDSVTTDHISPAGSIAKDSPAGQYLIEHGVEQRAFNSYGSRRGNDRVMTRGTFANIRLRNQLAPGTEGGVTVHLPSGRQMSIFEAAELYRTEGTPLVVLAGKEYGTGSSRDWAAKGTLLLGVRVVIAESFERIHRSNLVGMGVLPLQFKEGDTRSSLGITGQERFDFVGLNDDIAPGQPVEVNVVDPDSGASRTIHVRCRLDSGIEVDYYRNGGILAYVLRKLAGTR